LNTLTFVVVFQGETAGRTPLFCACAKGFQDIVQYLIDRGADVNGTEKVSEENDKMACILLLWLTLEWSVMFAYCGSNGSR
jgi:hypothetical protein